MLLISMALTGCLPGSEENKTLINAQPNNQTSVSVERKENGPGTKTVHVFVALCDNKYQGIVPVGKAIGNGQDPASNLYWGCDYGLKTYFRRKGSDWTLVQVQPKLSDTLLERLLFKHKTLNVYLLADAYNGKFIKPTTIDFLDATSGKNAIEISFRDETLSFGGGANLTAYMGHDGLMDFSIPLRGASSMAAKKETIILACYSRKFFSPHIKESGATPILWTTHLMAP